MYKTLLLTPHSFKCWGKLYGFSSSHHRIAETVTRSVKAETELLGLKKLWWLENREIDNDTFPFGARLFPLITKTGRLCTILRRARNKRRWLAMAWHTIPDDNIRYAKLELIFGFCLTLSSWRNWRPTVDTKKWRPTPMPESTNVLLPVSSRRLAPIRWSWPRLRYFGTWNVDDEIVPRNAERENFARSVLSSRSWATSPIWPSLTPVRRIPSCPSNSRKSWAG